MSKFNIHPFEFVAPPLDVQATRQTSISAPTEISWSPPSSNEDNITGYTIFFGSGENISLPSLVTSVSLISDETVIGQNISIRSEAAQQPPSEIITVTITAVGKF